MEAWSTLIWGSKHDWDAHHSGIAINCCMVEQCAGTVCWIMVGHTGAWLHTDPYCHVLPIAHDYPQRISSLAQNPVMVGQAGLQVRCEDLGTASAVEWGFHGDLHLTQI